MVKGVNANGEERHYIYNGLGYLIGNEWIIAKNNYGYNGVTQHHRSGWIVLSESARRIRTPADRGHQNPTGAWQFKGNGNTVDKEAGSTTGGTEGGVIPSINSKQSVVHNDYVPDYISTYKNVILETESGTGAIPCKYVYGIEKISVAMTGSLSGAGSLVKTESEKLITLCG